VGRVGRKEEKAKTRRAKAADQTIETLLAATTDLRAWLVSQDSVKHPVLPATLVALQG